MISSAQCRAARALLGWSQDDLEKHSRLSKKTIADFERDARNPQTKTSEALQVALESFGVVFIPQNGGGAGVRLRDALPRFFRREDVDHRRWVAFAFDYKDQRFTGFISYEALSRIALDNISPLDIFDRDRARILLRAAQKVDAGELDPEGRVLINVADVDPVEFNF